MSCVRCGHVPKDKEIHIFRGGENHRRLTELQLCRPVSTCKKLIPDDEFDQANFDEEKQEWIESRVAPTNDELERQATEQLDKLTQEGWIAVENHCTDTLDITDWIDSCRKTHDSQ